MNDLWSKNGFTLIEILVVLALIATILSMVYGSYFATSRSAQVSRVGIAMCHEGRTTLDQMARQIRCVYAGIAAETGTDESGLRQKKIVREDGMSYFTGNQDASNGEILRFVTTNGFAQEKENPAKGLFEITYRFDKHTRTLFFCQRRFIGTTKTSKGDWTPMARNVEDLDVEFFDGRQWLGRWEFEDEKELPCAVRVEIVYRDDQGRRFDYGTLAPISCRSHRAGTNAETLASANK